MHKIPKCSHIYNTDWYNQGIASAALEFTKVNEAST